MGTSEEVGDKAAGMLEEMIKATHQLDEILQRMCVESQGVRNVAIPSDEFQDCIGVAAGTTGEYFQNIRHAFLSCGQIEIPAFAVDIQSFFNGERDLAEEFATSTKDISFVFSSTASPSSRARNNWDEVLSPQPETHVSYCHFVSRLRQQIVACDHIVPVKCAESAVKVAVLVLGEQQKRLLGAIGDYFPYQDGPVDWVQSSRVCETLVEEKQQNNEWGLLIQSNVTCLLRASVDNRAGDSSSQGSSMEEVPRLSARSCCKTFLPKNQYLVSPGAFQASIAVTLAMIDAGEPKAVAKAPTARSEDERTYQIHASANNPGKEAVGFSLTTELPEILSVSEWGSHDDNPIPDERGDKQTECERAIASVFRKVHIETPFPRNRVVQAACSRFHTLFLNDMGLVFAYGHTVDGALGLGSELRSYIAQPTLVDFFFDNLIVVQDISCGGDQLVGAHSAAVSQDGGMFTWGVGVALGRGTLRSTATPQRIELPPVESNLNRGAAPPSSTLARSVSCGSGFCVALTREGHAFSWGKWSDGRLGLGRIPIIARTSRRHGAVRKQFQSFQLTPKQILSSHSSRKAAFGSDISHQDSKSAVFSKVACGDAHCVGLTKSGDLVTWGRGNNGQQGRGDASDTLSPTAVCKVNGDKQWRDVAAGENWSMALSSDGQVWTWGACGGAVLGHGLYGSQKNALLAETILQRHQRLLSQRKKSSASYPTLPCLKWMVPQIIPCFATPDIRVCRISAGAQHAAAISDTGDLYMWGTNYASNEADSDDTKRLDLSSLPKLVNSGQGVATNQGMTDLGTHSVEHVVCGGRQTIALTSGSFLARSMNKLYRESVENSKIGPTTSIGGADLVLVVSGQRIFTHKLLLAQRSPVLRELILEEEEQKNRRNERSDDGNNRPIPSREVMELLLPRLRADVARALVEFIYTDNFTMEVSKSAYYLVNDVLRAAKLYKLPSLVQLCRERLFSASPSSLFGGVAALAGVEEIPEEDEFSDDTNEEDASEQEESTRTLNDDMKFALSDEVWADTVLVVEGRGIPVHGCMLVARSEYFRAVLAFQRSSTYFTSDTQSNTSQTVVNVEDSYAGIVRVLRFIYYDQVMLPTLKKRDDSDTYEGESTMNEDASDQLLEDLVAADKYGLERMKRLCEHAICVTVANCLEVLAVAELVHAAHLKQVAMRFVQTHLADVAAREEEFRRFQEDFSPLMEELFTSLRDASREEFLLREWHKEVGTSRAAQREEQELQWGNKSAAITFPWIPLSLAIAFGAMYLSMRHAQEHEFAAVPATNLLAIAGIVGAIMMGYL